jgi:DNA-binding IclR family transcriptional regulator
VFRSAAPKILLAHLPRAPLVKFYEAHSGEIASSSIGRNWPEFRALLTQIRKAGRYKSLGELEPGLGSVAVPVFNRDGDCVAELASVGALRRFTEATEPALVVAATEAAAAISRAIDS